MINAIIYLMFAGCLVGGCGSPAYHHYGALQGLACDADHFYTTDDTGIKDFQLTKYDRGGRVLERFKIGVNSHGDDLSLVPGGYATTSPSKRGILFFNKDRVSVKNFWWLPKHCLPALDSELWVFACPRPERGDMAVIAMRPYARYPIFWSYVATPGRFVQGVVHRGSSVLVLNSGYKPDDQHFLLEVPLLGGSARTTLLPVRTESKYLNEPEGLAVCEGKLYTTINYGRRKRMRQVVYEIKGKKLIRQTALEAL